MPYVDIEKRRECSRKHYRNNKAVYIARAKKYTNNNRCEVRKNVAEYLREHPCVDCGEPDPVVLDFDHIGKKNFTISNGISKDFAWNKIKKEINLCEVVCANCHRKRTARRGKHWTYKLNI